jgi:hypothetical protein
MRRSMQKQVDVLSGRVREIQGRQAYAFLTAPALPDLLRMDRSCRKQMQGFWEVTPWRKTAHWSRLLLPRGNPDDAVRWSESAGDLDFGVCFHDGYQSGRNHIPRLYGAETRVRANRSQRKKAIQKECCYARKFTSFPYKPPAFCRLPYRRPVAMSFVMRHDLGLIRVTSRENNARNLSVPRATCQGARRRRETE